MNNTQGAWAKGPLPPWDFLNVCILYNIIMAYHIMSY